MLKKIKKILVTTLFIIFMMRIFVYANMTLDKSNIQDGILGFKYTGSLKSPLKITVEKDSNRYVYNLKNNSTNYIPLQMGNGTYKIALNQQISGTRYKIISAENLKTESIKTNNMYTYSTMITYFTSNMEAIKDYKKTIDGKSLDDKIYSVYKDVVYNYTYDYVKADNISNDYTPYIDDTYLSKQGICYDYAALMAGILRSEGIPTKLVMGYAPDINVYHSWNEIYMNGKWIVVDTTADAARVQVGHKVNFSKDASKFQVLKIY